MQLIRALTELAALLDAILSIIDNFDAIVSFFAALPGRFKRLHPNVVAHFANRKLILP